MSLIVHQVAEQLIDAIAPIAREVQRHDPDLAKQLRRAAQSIVLNIAEAEKLGDNGNQRVHFERAAGSNGETRAAMRIASSCGYVDEVVVKRCDRIADSVQAMLWKLTHR